MKTTIFRIAIIFAITLFSGCDKETGGGAEPVIPDKETKLEYTLGACTNMWLEDVRDVAILTEGAFDVQPLDDEIATVELLGAKKFKVTAKKVGETRVLIIDENDVEHTFFIEVADCISSHWVEYADKFMFDLKVSDPCVEAAIIKNIAEKLSYLVGGHILFDSDKMTFKTTEVANKISGKYEFDIHSKKMAFIYLDTKDSYKVITYPHNGSILALMADRTDYYKQLYPDEEIEKVVYIHFIGAWRIPGIPMPYIN